MGSMLWRPTEQLSASMPAVNSTDALSQTGYRICHINRGPLDREDPVYYKLINNASQS